jgi:hypothetical protein
MAGSYQHISHPGGQPAAHLVSELAARANILQRAKGLVSAIPWKEAQDLLDSELLEPRLPVKTQASFDLLVSRRCQLQAAV